MGGDLDGGQRIKMQRGGWVLQRRQALQEAAPKDMQLREEAGRDVGHTESSEKGPGRKEIS